MQDNKSLMRLKSCGSMLEAITTLKKATGGKTGEFSEGRCITYSVGNKTLVSLNITEEGFAGHVYIVYIDLVEDSGRGSAYLNLRLMRNGNGKGILCNYMNTKFVGSYDSCKRNYCVPPLPEREIVRYICRETGLGGCFTLEKKKDHYCNSVERAKATYDFVNGELTWHVKIKITNDRINALKVEVDGPVKLTSDYMNHVVSKMDMKIKNELEASKLSLMRRDDNERVKWVEDCGVEK